MGIKFDDIIDESLGIKLVSVNMGVPEPMTVTTEIPGKNGVLDQSEAVAGFITYREREFELLYTLMADNEEDYNVKLDNIRNKLHGQKRKIILSSSPDFYYEGRIFAEEEPQSSFFSEITLTGTAYPYKRKMNETVIQKTLTGKKENITCPNLAEPVVPLIETAAAVKITFGGKTISVNKGKSYLDTVFTAGNNVLTVTGTGNIKIMYREGSL